MGLSCSEGVRVFLGALAVLSRGLLGFQRTLPLVLASCGLVFFESHLTMRVFNKTIGATEHLALNSVKTSALFSFR